MVNKLSKNFKLINYQNKIAKKNNYQLLKNQIHNNKMKNNKEKNVVQLIKTGFYKLVNMNSNKILNPF